MIMGEKGIFSYIFVYAIILVLLGFLFVVAIPSVQKMQVHSYVISEDLLDDTNVLANSLGPGTIKNSAVTAINDQQDASATQFEILSFLSQWGWVFILMTFALAYLLTARRNVEYSGL